MRARENLRALGISEPTTEKMLVAANIQRTILGLPSIAALIETTSLKDGMATIGTTQPNRSQDPNSRRHPSRSRIPRGDYKLHHDARVAEVTSDLNALVDDPAVAASINQTTFYEIGIEIVVAGTCPFCDTAWDIDDLKKRVQVKIDRLKEVSLKRTAAEKKIAPLIVALGKRRLQLTP